MLTFGGGVLVQLAHDVGGVGDRAGSKRGIDSADAFPEPMLASARAFPPMEEGGRLSVGLPVRRHHCFVRLRTR